MFRDAQSQAPELGSAHSCPDRVHQKGNVQASKWLLRVCNERESAIGTELTVCWPQVALHHLDCSY